MKGFFRLRLILQLSFGIVLQDHSFLESFLIFRNRWKKAASAHSPSHAIHGALRRLLQRSALFGQQVFKQRLILADIPAAPRRIDEWIRFFSLI